VGKSFKPPSVAFGDGETEAYRAEKATREKWQQQVCNTIYYEDAENKVSGLDVLRAIKEAGYQRLYNPFVLLDLHSWGEKAIFSNAGDGYSQYVTQKHVFKKLLKEMKIHRPQVEEALRCAVTLALRDLEQEKLIQSAPFECHFLDSWRDRWRPLAAANQMLKAERQRETQPLPSLWETLDQLKEALQKLEIRDQRWRQELVERERLMGKDCKVYQRSKGVIQWQAALLNKVSLHLKALLKKTTDRADSPLLYPPIWRQYIVNKYMAHQAVVVCRLTEQALETQDPSQFRDLMTRIHSLLRDD
jgi:hypothetical protein